MIKRKSALVHPCQVKTKTDNQKTNVMNANIQNADSISVKNSISTSIEVLKSESYLPARTTAIEWYGELEQRISFTTDEKQLQKLDQWQKRLRILARTIDTQHEFIQYVNRTFTSLDDSFWAAAIDGEKLRAEIEDLKRQNECLLAGWKRERAYRTGKYTAGIMKVA